MCTHFRKEASRRPHILPSITRTAMSSPTCSAYANAEAASFRTDSAIKALKARYDAESESYAALKQALNLTNAELLAYVWIEATKERNAEVANGKRATTIAVSTPEGLEGA
jgi:hypothetical protein